ncbi:LysR family transcriptional regulator [Subtercola lobariae]|uniref:LysR family transcriptional regulator n=1 Tax=Subtercola lobariae TaxID=1588641 RepID=A0A917EXZ3_9MICO|nr:LysR family transcriptional regulator [Subtercola lobariae]GGF30660.1 LysR family transcriptional regulator [Subtercola lobariae]
MPIDEPGQNDLAARLTNVDLNLIPPLMALLQEQSVTLAAERIGLSQPAMSHTLARLRALLGDDLLVRSGSKYMLTPRARELLTSVPGVLRSVSERVLHVPAFDPARDARQFILSMTTSTAFLVAPLLLRITETVAPGASFEIRDSTEPGTDIFEKPELDVALVADTVATTYARSTLYRDRWVGVIDTANEQVDGDLTLEHLAALPHVAYQSATFRLNPYIALAAAGVTPTFELISSNFLLIPMLVADSNRIAIAQERLARRLADRFSLRILDLPLVVPPLGIDVLFNPRLAGDSATLWLVEAIRAELRATP